MPDCGKLISSIISTVHKVKSKKNKRTQGILEHLPSQPQILAKKSQEPVASNEPSPYNAETENSKKSVNNL